MAKRPWVRQNATGPRCPLRNLRPVPFELIALADSAPAASPAGAPGAVAPSARVPVLEVRHLGRSLSLGEQALEILRDITFTIPKGELVTTIDSTRPQLPGLMAAPLSSYRQGRGMLRPAESAGNFPLGRFTRPQARASRLPQRRIGPEDGG